MKQAKVSKTKTTSGQSVMVRWRFGLACLVFCGLALAIIVKLAQVQALPSLEQGVEFLKEQGEARTVRTEIIAAHRGVIADRNGEPLAISIPVQSVCADPSLLITAQSRFSELAQALKISKKSLTEEVQRYENKKFMYLQRHLPPAEADRILSLQIPGIFSREEYQRFYPAGEVAAHIVGMTNTDDEGLEGIEFAYNDWLQGRPGSKLVKKDLNGRIVEEMQLLKAAQPGNDLTLSVDMRLQHLAYRALKNAVVKHNAVSGSMVMLDSRNGEVLAMVSQPSYNPNNRKDLSPKQLSLRTKNRAITDQFEPGSTMKPLTVLAALESGKFTPHTKIDTNPGHLRLNGHTVYDPVNYGMLDVTRIITKSSQVGITKIALQLEPESVRDVFYRLGIGQSVGVGFPGEAIGNLKSHAKWSDVMRANYSYGYGLDTTTLQLAHVYATIANDGKKLPVSLLKLTDKELASRPAERVIDAQHSRTVLHMMETVLSPEGTGKRAQLQAYSAAGKTGTAHKATGGGYQEEEKFSVFVGVAPASDPRIVVAIMIDEPRAGLTSGGEVSAPVFAEVAGNALRILQVPPDKKQTLTRSDHTEPGIKQVSQHKQKEPLS